MVVMQQKHQPPGAAAAAAVAQQGGCCYATRWTNNQRQQPWWLWCCVAIVVLLCCCNKAAASEAVVPCPGRPHCVSLVVDGTIQSIPPIFRQAVTNSSVNEIVLASSRYVLRPSSWAVFSQQEPYRLRRNLTIRGDPDAWAVMDFSLIEKKVLITAGVTVTFRSLILANVRKLGGFGLDFFMGEAGSRLVLEDTVRVKPACQLPSDVLRSAQSFSRVSPAYPPNDVRMIPKLCMSAALDSSVPQPYCFLDVLQFNYFSLLAAYNDPDKGTQYPGYILYQENTTRVCQSTISAECMQKNNNDEELCMAVLLAATSLTGAQGETGHGRAGLSPSVAAGIAVACAIFVLLLFLLCILRRKLLQLLWPSKQHGKRVDDPELGLSLHADSAGAGSFNTDPPGYNIGKNISQHVTLNTLLGTGSFGRVYKGRWHSTDVAIKIVTVRNPDELPRVLHEAEVMMKLDHGNIVHAYHASVWNPSEQMRALKVKASRDARNHSNGSNARMPISAAAAAAAAAGASGSNADASGSGRGRRQGLRHSNSGLRSTCVQSAPAAPGMPTSGQHLTTPSVSSEPPVALQQYHHTGSTPINSSSGGLGRSGHTAGAAARLAVSRASAQVTGWLQLVPHHHPQQQQQQQGAALGRQLSGSAADCSSTRLGDVDSRELPHVSAGAAALSASQQDDALYDAHQQHRTSATQQQQQKQPGPASTGGLRRHLLSGWRSRSSKSAGSSAANNVIASSSSNIDGAGSTACSGSSAVVAAAAAAAASGASAGWIHSSLEGNASRHSAQDAAGTISGVSSGGPVAILHAPEVLRASSKRSSRQSGGSRGAYTDSRSSHTDDDDEEEQRVHSEQQVWIILELCTGGTLLDAALCGKLRLGSDADGTDGRLGMAKLLCRLLDAAHGMAYLHSKGVMHGDLKAGNVLLQHSIHGSYGLIAKISDFGLSAVLLNGSTHRSTASLGTITHMAPELLRNGRMSPSADVYSFGVLMWEVYCGKQAWQGLHYGVVVERVVIAKERPPVPADMPVEYELLMTRCWAADAAERPSFPQIVECLELMLDNMGSSDSASDDEGSAHSMPQQPAAAAGATSTNSGAGSGLSAQQGEPHLLLEQHQQQQVDRLLVPGAAAAALAIPAMHALAAAPAAAAAPGAALGPAGSSAHESPSTPVNAMRGFKRHPSAFDSGLSTAPSGGQHVLAVSDAGHASHGHSSSSHIHSSNPHSSQLAQGSAGASTGVKLPRVLDESVFLQDL